VGLFFLGTRLLAVPVHFKILREPFPAVSPVTFAPPKEQHRQKARLALAGLLLGLLEDLLDDLLLLDQEGTDNAVLDAASAAGTTVGTADILLRAGDLGVLAGTESGDLKIKIVSRSDFQNWCETVMEGVQRFGRPVIGTPVHPDRVFQVVRLAYP
jgi:hypothetical protein